MLINIFISFSLAIVSPSLDMIHNTYTITELIAQTSVVEAKNKKI